MGKEGPMLHAGSILAVILGSSNCFRQKMDVASHWGSYTYSRDIRDLVACGATCGVCTAFKAPVGGVLFAMEMSTRCAFSGGASWGDECRHMHEHAGPSASGRPGRRQQVAAHARPASAGSCSRRPGSRGGGSGLFGQLLQQQGGILLQQRPWPGQPQAAGGQWGDGGLHMR